MKIRELLVAISVSVNDRGAKKLADALDGIVKFAPKVGESLAATERAAAKAAREHERASAKIEKAKRAEAKAAERAAAQVEKARMREEKAAIRTAEKAERAVMRSLSAQERAEHQRVREVEKAAAAVERAKAKEARAYDKAMAATQRATDRSVAEIRRLSKSNQETFDTLQYTRSGQRKEARREVGGAAMEAGGSLARGAGAFVGGLAVAGGLALQTASEFESLRAQIKQLSGGDVDKATETFNRIKDFATKTPSSLQEVTTAFVKLRGAGLDSSEEALRSYGDTAATMGKSLDVMVEAVKDAATGEFERLKELNITAKSSGDQVTFTYNGIATTVGKTKKEIEAYLLSVGKLPGVQGAMAVQMDTLNGKWSNFKDSIATAIDTAVTSSGALDGAKGLLSDLTESAGSAATALGTVLADGLKTARQWLSSLTAEDIQGWLDTAVSAGLAMIDMIRGAVAAIQSLVEFAGQMTDALSLSDGAATTLALSFAALALAGGGLPGVFAAVAVGAAAMGTAVGNAIDGMDNQIWVIEQRIKELKSNISDMQAKETEIRDDMADDAAIWEEKARLREKGATVGREREAAAAEAQFNAIAAANQSGFGEELFATAEEQAGGKGWWTGKTAEQAALANAGGGAGLGGKAGRAKMRLDAAKSAELDRVRKAGGDVEARAAGIAAKELKARKAFTDATRKGLSEADALAAAERELLDQGKPKKGGKGKKDPKQQDILEQLGLKGPGSILEDRPSPQSLTISTTIIIKMADKIEVPITMPPGATFESTAEEAGTLVGEKMSAKVMEIVEPVVERVMALKVEELGKMRGGGRVPRTARRGGAS